MAFPQQVINQLNREPAQTPGWSFGIIMFAGGLFLLAVLAYFGILLIYEPYLNNQYTDAQNQVTALSNSISAADQNQLITFYSQVTNLQTLLAGHVFASQFFAWLEQNTESNVYYSQLSLVGGGQVALVADAKTEADVNQQIAIFEASPEVQSVSVSNVGIAGSSGLWQFNVALVMQPSLFLASTTAATAPVPTSTTP